jgi:lipopolysaccharide biosynthesis regulator YciM
MLLDYRDPLFSILLFLALIIATVLITNFVGEIKERSRTKHLKEFMEKFNFLDNYEIKTLFSNNVSLKALFLLGMAFEKEGDYEKSLNVYLAILDKVSKEQKFEILQRISELYFSAGFLHKAREAVLEILRSKPRDIKALKTLLIIDDKLKNFDEIENIIEIFEELELDIKKEKGYLLFQKYQFSNEIDKIRELLDSYPCLKREYISYLKLLNSNELYEIVSERDVYEMLDLFWEIEELPDLNRAFIDIKLAKKEISSDNKEKSNIKSPIFELELLKYVPKELADLEFEYICSNCKNIFPIYQSRCPKCRELFTFKVEPIVVEIRRERV